MRICCPVARSKSRWWHRPESRSDRARADRPAIDACFHRCVAASPPSVVALFARGVCRACAAWPPGLLPAALAPTCSLARCRAWLQLLVILPDVEVVVVLLLQPQL